jgi:hypothetical protein
MTLEGVLVSVGLLLSYAKLCLYFIAMLQFVRMVCRTLRDRTRGR